MVACPKLLLREAGNLCFNCIACSLHLGFLSLMLYSDFVHSMLLLQIPEEMVPKENDHSSEVAEGLTYSGMPLR